MSSADASISLSCSSSISLFCSSSNFGFPLLAHLLADVERGRFHLPQLLLVHLPVLLLLQLCHELLVVHRRLHGGDRSSSLHHHSSSHRRRNLILFRVFVRGVRHSSQLGTN